MRKDVVYTREVGGLTLLFWTILRLAWSIVLGIFGILLTLLTDLVYPLLKFLCKGIYNEIIIPCARYIKRKRSGVGEIEYH